MPLSKWYSRRLRGKRERERKEKKEGEPEFETERLRNNRDGRNWICSRFAAITAITAIKIASRQRELQSEHTHTHKHILKTTAPYQ